MTARARARFPPRLFDLSTRRQDFNIINNSSAEVPRTRNLMGVCLVTTAAAAAAARTSARNLRAPSIYLRRYYTYAYRTLAAYIIKSKSCNTNYRAAGFSTSLSKKKKKTKTFHTYIRASTKIIIIGHGQKPVTSPRTTPSRNQCYSQWRGSAYTDAQARSRTNKISKQ